MLRARKCGASCSWSSLPSSGQRVTLAVLSSHQLCLKNASKMCVSVLEMRHDLPADHKEIQSSCRSLWSLCLGKADRTKIN